MKHAVSRTTDYKVDSISLDDLAPTEEERGSRWMQFQRLGVQQTSGLSSSTPSPENRTYTSVGTISNISSDSRKLHALGLLALSDYHVLDGPPYLHDLSPGSPAIGDTTRTATKGDFERFTSLNHNIHFHIHENFRADELCYIEVTSPWSSARRANIQSRIFTSDGRLIANCFQEGYFVLAAGEKGKSKM